MRKAILAISWSFLAIFGFVGNVFAGDLTCYGYTSTTNHFACNIPPANSGNCTWWAAYKRPDLAIAGITGDAAEWYDNAHNLGFSVGSKPGVGAIVVFSYPSHVAHTESTNNDGSFGVSEMDATGRLGKGVQYATYYPDGNGKFHRNNGSPSGWTLKGFIYPKGTTGPSPPVTMCARKDATHRVCWLTKNGEDRSCEHATAWGIEDHIRRVSDPTSVSVCPTVCYEGQTVSSALDFFVSPAFAAKTLSSCAFRETSSDYESSISSLGEGYPIPATDPKVVNKPDFIIARSRLFAVDRMTEQYHFKKTDTMCMEGKLKNIGSGKIGDSDKVRTRFMVSNGYKEFI